MSFSPNSSNFKFLMRPSKDQSASESTIKHKQIILTKIDNKVKVGNIHTKEPRDIRNSKQLSFTAIKDTTKEEHKISTQNSFKVIPSMKTWINETNKFPFFVNINNPFGSLNKADTTENNRQRNLLMGRDKKYKNENEILIVKKKPSMSYVRSILCPNERESEKLKTGQDFYNENYNFEIPKKYAGDFKSKGEYYEYQFPDIKRNGHCFVKSKSASDVFLNTKINKERDKSRFIVNFNNSKEVSRNISYCKESDENNCEKFKDEIKKELNLENNDNDEHSGDEVISDIATRMDTPLKRHQYYQKLSQYSTSRTTEFRQQSVSSGMSLQDMLKMRTQSLILDSLKFDKTKLYEEKIKTSRLCSIVDKIDKRTLVFDNPILRQTELPAEQTANLSPESTKDAHNQEMHFYYKEQLYKNKIISKYISRIKIKEFISNIPRHRKIFVIPDGSVVINQKHIPGKLIDLPTKRVRK